MSQGCFGNSNVSQNKPSDHNHVNKLGATLICLVSFVCANVRCCFCFPSNVSSIDRELSRQLQGIKLTFVQRNDASSTWKAINNNPPCVMTSHPLTSLHLGSLRCLFYFETTIKKQPQHKFINDRRFQR